MGGVAFEEETLAREVGELAEYDGGEFAVP